MSGGIDDSEAAIRDQIRELGRKAHGIEARLEMLLEAVLLTSLQLGAIRGLLQRAENRDLLRLED